MEEIETVAAEKNEFPKFGIRDKVGYAFGDFGCNLSFTLIASFMTDFYTQFIGIGAAAWTAIIMVTKIWDGVNDPIMGSIMDAVRIGKGRSKFKPWMRIGAVSLIFTGALVFIPIPRAAMWAKITVCVLSYMLWDFSYTLMNVPYGALNSAISADPIERTQLSTWRSIGAGLGSLICMLLPLLVYDKKNNLVGGRLIWLGLGMGVLAFFAYIACLKMTVERVPTVVEDGRGGTGGKFNYLETLKGFVRNRPLLAMCLASFSMLVFFGSFGQTTKWLFQVHFGDAGAGITLASIVSVLPVVLMLPFVTKLVKRFGKKACVGVPLLGSVIAAAVMMFIPFPGNEKGAIAYVAGFMVVQLGGGMFSLVNWAMITDCIDYQEIKTGRREEGSVYAMYSLFRKIAQGVALSLPLLCMTGVGFNPKADPIGNQAPGVPQKMLLMSIGLVMIGAFVAAVSFLLVYNLGKKDVERMSETLGRAEKIDLSDAVINKNE